MCWGSACCPASAAPSTSSTLHGGKRLTLQSVPQDDPETYAMLRRADSLGVFQVESRAQMNMLPRLRPREFYDLVIQVAIVRPGPIQGDMVHPYLRRRNGEEQSTIPRGAASRCWSKTLGVPLFQEQAMQIAIVGAGFTPAEADELRRAMATFRHVGTIQHFREKFIERHGGERLSSATSPTAASARSRASAPTASPKATPPASPSWSMSPPG